MTFKGWISANQKWHRFKFLFKLKTKDHVNVVYVIDQIESRWISDNFFLRCRVIKKIIMANSAMKINKTRDSLTIYISAMKTWIFQHLR